MWKQAVSKNSGLESVISLSPNAGSKWFKKKQKETRYRKESRALLLFFIFATSITALCREADKQGILVTPGLPENVIDSKLCQASKVS